MQRGSDHMNVHRDDEMKKEMQGLLRSGHATRAEEWNSPEPEADDDPRLTNGPVTAAPGGPEAREREDETLRSDLARHLGRSAFPADRAGLATTLDEHHAPDELQRSVRQLPARTRYHTVQEVVTALGRKPRS